MHIHLYEDRKKMPIPEDGYKSGDLVLIKMKEGFKRAKNIVRNWGPFLVLKNYGNGLLQIQYSDGGVGDVATTELIRYAHSQVEGDDSLSQSSSTVVDQAHMDVNNCSGKPGHRSQPRIMKACDSMIQNRGELQRPRLISIWQAKGPLVPGSKTQLVDPSPPGLLH